MEKLNFRKLTGLLTTGVIAAALITSNAISPKRTDACQKPFRENVIIMISDGCGYNHIDAASMYEYGKTGVQVYEHFPVSYAMSTYSTGSYDPIKVWSSFNYVKNGPTDSAAAATAMATGSKTYDAAIGVDKKGKALKNIVERAEELGKATGVVTSVEFSHATPASFVAHNVDRNNYEAIAKEMIMSSKTDVIMGAGNPWFDDNGIRKSTPNSYKYVGGETIWAGLVNGSLNAADADEDGIADPWTLIQSREQFQTLMYGDTPKRVIGVPEVYSTLQQVRGGDSKADPYKVPLNESVPTLGEMSVGALNVLDNDEEGFFLMIEGGAIDWASEANQSGRMIEEEIAFNKAVEAVVDWVNKNSSWNKTLLVVTGDHETGHLTGTGANPEWKPLLNNGKGMLPGMQWNTGKHTNSLIPVFAKGRSARLIRKYADEKDPLRGLYIDNTELSKVLFSAVE